jgi:Holin of 3TMs, for gene-transfer release
MADETAEKMSASEKKKEDWMNSKWRPMMGWMYMLICTMDMVVFPILWSLLQSISHGAVNSQWQPLTLQGAGLFHIAMGAVLGIAAHGRTQEKLNGANNGGLGGAGLGTTYVPPGQGSVSVSNQPGGSNNGGFNSPAGGSTAFGAPAAGGFGNTGGFSSPAPASTGFGGNSGFGAGASGSPTVVTGFGGKPAPIQPPQPLL